MKQNINVSPTKTSSARLSCIIAIGYVVLGTIYSLLYWTGAVPDLEGWGLFLFYFFLPVAGLSIAIIFATQNPAIAILFGQLISFFIVWGIIYCITAIIRSLLNNTTKRY